MAVVWSSFGGFAIRYVLVVAGTLNACGEILLSSHRNFMHFMAIIFIIRPNIKAKFVQAYIFSVSNFTR